MCPNCGKHEKFRINNREGGTALIVAIDACPGGFVVNVLLESEQQGDGPNAVLAPVGVQHLESHLVEMIAEQVDVTEYGASYDEWKNLAQLGKAGFFTCSPAEVLKTVRNA